MTVKARFQMRLAEFKEGIRYVGLSFRSFIEDPERKRVLSDPVISPIVGDSIDYGPLFAYLFRRFGYPNLGWDDYKELAKYVLTTPHPDMLMQVVPYAGGTTCITFRFFVPKDVEAAIEAFDKRDILAWEQRAFAWREQQGLPDWIPDWIRLVNETLRPAWGSAGPDVTDWRESLSYAMTLGNPDSPYYALSKQAEDFRKSLYNEYRDVEPEPARGRRGEDFTQWDENDPLKPFADAAQIALKSLHRPVRVRDIAINAFGTADYSSKVLKEAPAAGFPSGDLGNEAPKEFAELHGLILQLGKGNARKGIAKLMAAAKECA